MGVTIALIREELLTELVQLDDSGLVPKSLVNDTEPDLLFFDQMKTTFYKKYKSCKKWQNKARVIQLYHAYMVVKNGKFSMRDVASYFDLSLGTISEAIKLAENMPFIKDCLTRKEALSKIK